MAGIKVSPPLLIFLLYLEPLVAFVAAFYASFRPFTYLYNTHASSTTSLLIPSAPSPSASALSLWEKFTTFYTTGSLPSSYTPPTIAAHEVSSGLLEQMMYLPGATAITTALAQLGNMWLFFALNQALVLRAVYPLQSKRDIAVWKAVTVAMLVADLGHLWSARLLGDPMDVFVRFWDWNLMGFANVGMAYLAILSRVAILTEFGFTGASDAPAAQVAVPAKDKKKSR